MQALLSLLTLLSYQPPSFLTQRMLFALNISHSSAALLHG